MGGAVRQPLKKNKKRFSSDCEEMEEHCFCLQQWTTWHIVILEIMLHGEVANKNIPPHHQDSSLHSALNFHVYPYKPLRRCALPSTVQEHKWYYGSRWLASLDSGLTSEQMSTSCEGNSLPSSMLVGAIGRGPVGFLSVTYCKAGKERRNHFKRKQQQQLSKEQAFKTSKLWTKLRFNTDKNTPPR